MIHRSVAFLLAVVDELHHEVSTSAHDVSDQLKRRGLNTGLVVPHTIGGCVARLERARAAGLVTGSGGSWHLTAAGRDELAEWRRKHGYQQPWEQS